jgi:1-deoxy-D-xylulose-5-phosphate synthase
MCRCPYWPKTIVFEATVVNARFIKPLDRELILPQARNVSVISLPLKKTRCKGGFGSAILELFNDHEHQ